MAASEAPLVLEEEHGFGVVQLTLNRPRALNALNEAMYYAAAAALRRHNKLPSTRIIVLTGAGTRSFCAGMDIKEVCSLSQGPRTVRAARAFMDALMLCDKPVVAAVFGPVTGIGVTLLLHCDSAYTTSDATFETPFSAIGIVPEFGSSVTFPLFLGLRLTNELLLKGGRVGAEEMGEVGAVTVVQSTAREVVERAVKEAVNWSRRNATKEEWGGVLKAKRIVREPIRKRVNQAMAVEMKAIDKQIVNGTAARLMRRRVAELKKRGSKL